MWEYLSLTRMYVGEIGPYLSSHVNCQISSNDQFIGCHCFIYYQYFSFTLKFVCNQFGAPHNLAILNARVQTCYYINIDEIVVFNQCVPCFSYTKPKGQLPDYQAPVVLRSQATTVENFCMKIHKSLLKDFKQ